MQQLSLTDLRGRLLGCALGLVLFYTVGAASFVAAERENELLTYQMNQVLYSDMKSMYEFEHCADASFSGLGFCRDQREFSHLLEEFFNEHGNSVVDKEQWTYLGAVFFLTQLTATIGYGNTACATTLGQLLTLVFLVAGVPLMGYTIFMMALANQRLCFALARRAGLELDSYRRQAALLMGVFAIFLLLGSLVYHVLEGWGYLEALYFSFTTLTTIGFGDYLPSTRVSKVFSIFYIIVGLGNCASIIALLAVNVEQAHMGVDEYVRHKARDCLSTD
jgi:hypothetical protein